MGFVVNRLGKIRLIAAQDAHLREGDEEKYHEERNRDGCGIPHLEPRERHLVDVPVDGTMTAGRISGDDHAKKRCPIVCQRINLKWNGHWATARWKAMSFCICVEMNELSY